MQPKNILTGLWNDTFGAKKQDVPPKAPPVARGMRDHSIRDRRSQTGCYHRLRSSTVFAGIEKLDHISR